jgi:phytoene synthase
MAASAADSFAYCAAEVRRFDHDRYLAALFAPADRRRALMALYAFNLEVAKVREVVSEPLIGRMRLQWWRERMDDIYAGSPPRHEIATALAEAVGRFNLDRRHLDRLLAAREADMAEGPPADLAALEAYVEGTSSALVALSLETLDAPDAALARSAGLAWGLTGLIRALPHHARARRLYLPADALNDVGITPEDVYSRRKTEAITAVVRRVAEAAETHLTAARAGAGNVLPRGLAALLPLALVESYLRRIRRRGYDGLGDGLEIGGVARQVRIGLAAWRKRV